jgi:hypothetical protein
VFDWPADASGRDADEWDERCDYLVVTDDLTDEIVGTRRLLPPEQAAAVGRTYRDGEFDLSRYAALRAATVEAGRSCVHPDHRSGAVITQFWAGIARYMLERGHRYLAGCASISLVDHGAIAAGVWDLLRSGHLAPCGAAGGPAPSVRRREPTASRAAHGAVAGAWLSAPGRPRVQASRARSRLRHRGPLRPARRRRAARASGGRAGPHPRRLLPAPRSARSLVLGGAAPEGRRRDGRDPHRPRCPGGGDRAERGLARASEGRLVVANHISWIDELALLSAVPGMPVATERD